LFKTLPAREQRLIREQARRKASSFNCPLGRTMEAHYIVSVTGQRHSDQLATFDHWKAIRA
jgi:hypothetical protein